MKKICVATLLFVVMSCFFELDAEELILERVDSYKHDTFFGRFFFDALVDKDGSLILAYGEPGCSVVDKSGVKRIAPLGEGPNDLSGFFSLNLIGEELFIEGMYGKMHVFKKKDGLYTWIRTDWRQTRKSFSPSDSLFFKNNWYVAAFDTSYDKRDKKFTVDYLQVFSSTGKIIKQMIREEFAEPWSINLFDCYLNIYGDSIFFLSEDKLVLRIITGDDPNVSKIVELASPEFYKKMPEAFYHFPKTGEMVSSNDFRKFLSLWKTDYSRICNAVVDGNRLIIQLRTCDKNRKVFGLLFYDAGSFELKATLYTNDFLLTGKNGKLYFIRGGDPAWDEIDESIFDIYTIVAKK